MSLRTPLGRVLGLGSAKEGVSHWWTQRFTAAALVPLMLWFLISLLRLGSMELEAVQAWLATPLNAVLMLLLVIALGYHSRLGVQVVVEDYVHQHALKLIALVLVDFAHVVAGGISVFAVLKVAFGGTA